MSRRKVVKLDQGAEAREHGHMERRVDLRQLRDEASALVDAVEAGESVVITRRGREVARLIPVDRGTNADAALRGTPGVVWSGRRPGVPIALRPVGSGPSAAETVLRDRGQTLPSR